MHQTQTRNMGVGDTLLDGFDSPCRVLAWNMFMQISWMLTCIIMTCCVHCVTLYGMMYREI